jgi:hypothetical protein
MNAELTSTLLLLTDQFSALADPKQAQGMKKYMKDLFPFLGIKKPIRSAAEKACIAECKKLPYDTNIAHSCLWKRHACISMKRA